jgi:CyaY protein
MDESRYQSLAEIAFRKIEDGLRDVDAEDVDCERSGDVLTLTFKGGKRAVINTQRPTRQIWLAANARAWHFSYEDKDARWFDDKDASLDLFTALSRVVKDGASIDVSF